MMVPRKMNRVGLDQAPHKTGIMKMATAPDSVCSERKSLRMVRRKVDVFVFMRFY